MKPDAYMPWFVNDFWQATAGRSDGIIVAYMRALGHYWVHCACQGLPNDDAYLRRICQRFDDWEDVKPIVFGVYFKLDDTGRWQQQRCQKEYARSLEVYQVRSQAGKKAATIKWDRVRNASRNAPRIPPGNAPRYA